MRSIVVLVMMAACSRSGGGPPPPPPDPQPDAVTLVAVEACGFSVESPGEPAAIGLHLSCYQLASDAPVDSDVVWEIGIAQVFGGAGDVAPEPARQPETIAGHPALGLRFAMSGGRSAAGVLIRVGHRVDIIWSSELSDAALSAVIASYR